MVDHPANGRRGPADTPSNEAPLKDHPKTSTPCTFGVNAVLPARWRRSIDSTVNRRICAPPNDPYRFCLDAGEDPTRLAVGHTGPNGAGATRGPKISKI